MKAKIFLFFALVSFVNLCDTEAQSINIRVLKDFIEASVKMSDNYPNKKIAKQVKRTFGVQLQNVEYYTVLCDLSKEKPCFHIIDSAWTNLYEIDKRNYYNVNVYNGELIHLTSSSREFMSQRATLEGQHNCIYYYLINSSKLSPVVNEVLYKEIDTVIRDVPSLVFYTSSAKHKWETMYYIRKSNYELDSVICVHTFDDGVKRVYEKQHITNIPKFDYARLKKAMDFGNPRYSGFSHHDNKNMPYSLAWSENEDFSDENVINFQLQDLNNKKTSIKDEEGWILVDLWEFGCGGCYAGFRRLGRQIDSIGQTVLEKHCVKILCVNPMSDNMEFIERIAEKYHVHNLLYSGKGLTTQVDIIMYPTYYLISPNKEVVKKGSSFKDEEILEAIEKYNSGH